jgi:ribosome recycling factor
MLEEILEDLKQSNVKAHEALKRELSRLRAGRASASMLDGVRVDYYGTPTPIAQMATVTVPEPRLIQIKIWERGQAKAVEKALRESDLNLNPQVDGDILRIPLPSLTEERRKELATLARKHGEEC